eukprot:Gregarina_sp_Poly_1__7907@NODE_44_length_17989_cov_118_013391_g38_i0_p5_GENE_NODE_44_length_17989_cov_118_013391_g38_i0NODE_44_length_17989_cov_118_013391_g38_i0_p5_ORF_typecomplete_len202_score19_62_NODE_44_length_17989_cov_118_013391_g38_i01042511030
MSEPEQLWYPHTPTHLGYLRTSASHNRRQSLPPKTLLTPLDRGTAQSSSTMLSTNFSGDGDRSGCGEDESLIILTRDSSKMSKRRCCASQLLPITRQQSGESIWTEGHPLNRAGSAPERLHRHPPSAGEWSSQASSNCVPWLPSSRVASSVSDKSRDVKWQHVGSFEAVLRTGRPKRNGRRRRILSRVKNLVNFRRTQSQQ